MAKMKTLTVNGKTYTVTDPNAANALRGTATGNPVCITDCSPVEHEMAVTVSGDTDLSTVTVSRYGEDYAVNKTIALATATSAGSLTMANGGLKAPLKAGHTYTIFADITSDAEEKKFRVDKQDFGALGYFNGEGRQSLTITIGESDCDYVRFYSAKDNTVSKTVATTFSNITIVEEQDVMTHIADQQGNVAGLISLYPTTTLIADSGVTVTAQYNKDTNKVVQRLAEAVRLLGGNV